MEAAPSLTQALECTNNNQGSLPEADVFFPVHLGGLYTIPMSGTTSEEVDWAFEDSKRYPIAFDYDVGKVLGEYVLVFIEVTV